MPGNTAVAPGPLRESEHGMSRQAAVRYRSATFPSCCPKAICSSQLRLSSNRLVTISLTRIPTLPSSINSSRSASFIAQLSKPAQRRSPDARSCRLKTVTPGRVAWELCGGKGSTNTARAGGSSPGCRSTPRANLMIRRFTGQSRATPRPER
jgi:hypothetical protein